MSDSRRGQGRRADSRQMWDDSDRRDRHRDTNRDRDRRSYRSRSRDRRPGYDNSRDEGAGSRRERSRSPYRRPGDRDADGPRGGGGGRGRGGYESGRDRRGHWRDDDEGRDRRGNYSRRSQSPPSSLPTRSRTDPKQPTNTKPDRRTPSPPRGRSTRTLTQDEDPSMDVEEGEEGEEEDDDGTAAMKAMMGFSGFGTTKNQKVAGNNAGGVRKEKQVEYRQYMNRQGGFNRPLSPSR